MVSYDRRTAGGKTDGGRRRSWLRKYVRRVCCTQTAIFADRTGELLLSRHIVCLTFDFDTMSGFIARGMTTPTPLSRGEFGVIGARRILALLRARGIHTTWFIPGFTIETYPDECEAVLAGGHEIAHHSWAHVPPASQTPAEEEADLVRANETIRRLTGRKARGYRSPSWDLSPDTIRLLIEHGFLYDSSLMGGDYSPYRARRGDQAVLGEPYRFGAETELIEMPISWSLDDYPHFEFLRTKETVLPGLQPPRTVMQNWLDEFRYMKKSVEFGVLTYTMHPYVIGRGYRMLAFEDFLARLIDEGATFMTLEEAARTAEAQLLPKK
jgi:peptidoglycan-N-acetylglucosamine deacetylase